MEVETTLLVEEENLPKGHFPLHVSESEGSFKHWPRHVFTPCVRTCSAKGSVVLPHFRVFSCCVPNNLFFNIRTHLTGSAHLLLSPTQPTSSCQLAGK